MSIIKQGQILRSAIDGTPLQIGQEFKLDNYRVPVTLQDGTPPHRPGTSGYVYVRFPGAPQGQPDNRYYASVIDAEWAQEGSPFFSKHLRSELRNKSHAFLEDNLQYADEGAEALTREAIAGITLDHLDAKAIEEYREKVTAHGSDAAEAEAARHVYEA